MSLSRVVAPSTEVNIWENPADLVQANESPWVQRGLVLSVQNAFEPRL